MIRRLSLLLAIAVVWAVFTVGPAGAVRLPGHFGEMDGDEDGFVSWQECRAYIPNVRRADFEAIDRNKDGRLDYTEWQASRTKLGLVKDGLGKEQKDLKDKDVRSDPSKAGAIASQPKLKGETDKQKRK